MMLHTLYINYIFLLYTAKMYMISSQFNQSFFFGCRLIAFLLLTFSIIENRRKLG